MTLGAKSAEKGTEKIQGENLGNQQRSIPGMVLLWLRVILVAAWVSHAWAVDWPELRLVPVFSVTQPTCIAHAGDGSGRLFVVEQPGTIRMATNGVVLPQPFLEITSRVMVNPEQGLLGLAFPTNYAAKQYFYVYYNRQPDGATVLSRFFVSSTGLTALPDSEQVLLVVPHPDIRHNGGQIAFGPDGYLYVGTGDGTSSSNSQDPGSLLGKILRLDVESGANGYVIPPDNPFLARTNFQPEIWAMGLRNPWRFSFDRLTGDLFIGDVGSAIREEINFQAASSRGGENYGWGQYEGTVELVFPPTLDREKVSWPIVDYGNGPGVAVIGGYVYRGKRFPRMSGLYFFGDFGRSAFWAVARVGNEWTNQSFWEHQISPCPFPTTLGEDEAGEIYVANVYGTVYRFEDAMQCSRPTFEWPDSLAFDEKVQISTVTSDATIHYTTEARDPTENDPSADEQSRIPVTLNTRLRVRAFRSDLQPSEVAEHAYARWVIARPVALPEPGSRLRLSCRTQGAAIHYTLDGSTPTENSPLYDGSVLVVGTNLLLSRAFKAGYEVQAVIYSRYRLSTITSILRREGNVEITCDSIEQTRYMVQWSSDLRNWFDSGYFAWGWGGDLKFTIPRYSPEIRGRFFRMRMEFF